MITLRWRTLHDREACFGCRSGDWTHYRLERTMTARRSPTARTMDALREQGWTPWVVEKRKGPVSVDLFNFGDILAMRLFGQVPGGKFGGDFLIVQATTGSNVNARVRKILAEPMAKTWLECEGLIQVFGWRYLKRAKAWEPIVREIVLEDFDG